MIIREVQIKNKFGIHARPSSLITELANTFKSSITFEKDGRTADARNIMSLILLCVGPHSSVLLHVDGEDENEAMEAFVNLIEERLFDEDTYL